VYDEAAVDFQDDVSLEWPDVKEKISEESLFSCKLEIRL
jgi:hypothetical protein